MLISHKNRFVFIHNPKVAGTSFRNMLCANFECEDMRFNARVDGICQDQAHLRVDQWPEDLWKLYIEGYYFFALMRDPRDRFMSSMSEFWYQHKDMAEALNPTNLRVQPDKELNLKRDQLLQTLLTPNSINYDVRLVHFTEQWRFFDYGPCVDPERATNMDIDVFLFEGLDNLMDSEYFAKRLGAAKKLVLQNDRPSFHRDDDLSEGLERMIPFLYAEDYRRFSDTYIPKCETSFLSHTHSHRLEFVHRYPQLVEVASLNEREVNAHNREKPEYTSMSQKMLAMYARKATYARRRRERLVNV